MEPGYLEGAISWLRASGVGFDPGLSVEEVQAAFGFRFPPDLRALLQAALPISEDFPGWREGNRTELRERLGGPLERIRFDVEHNDLWPEHWGRRPPRIADAPREAQRRVAAAPVLIPVYSHRYVPDRPHSAGNPVFSVYQLDTIRYGSDLPSYLQAEFGVPLPDRTPGPRRRIEV